MLKQNTTIEISLFENSGYNVEITEQDTIEEIYGIIERKLGVQYRTWFTLELVPDSKETEVDYYELSNTKTGILVRANSGVCLAVGINYYLKQFCNVHISQVGIQNKMPELKITDIYFSMKKKIN